MNVPSWVLHSVGKLRGDVEYDYVSPSLPKVRCDAFFPAMVRGDRQAVTWPHFRKTISHRWYVDRRNPLVGFLNRDEACLLYANACLFRGKRGIEIGAWRGWSTCHLGLAGLQLDVVEPLLQDEAWRNEMTACLSRAGVMSRITLHAGTSPAKVFEISSDSRWSFAFIDGDHEGNAPRTDALACLPNMAQTAMILFHDMLAPAVSEALAELRANRWQTQLYQTSQIMGVGWRGNVHPVNHRPDPFQQWDLPPHLQSFPIAGETIEDRANRFGKILNEASASLQPGAADGSRRIPALLQQLGWPLTGGGAERA